ncbi:V-type ATP synthase subunit A [Amycolatopsis taiwanensis]|uniref:V-type ATP synthase alpha chain n=1 Tax=Amycolatopsis taiwanensis TaxID=342230 RepID=A0A9W6R6Y8_9PSEU|nr:V-type ATP synthase subunit A [Amycolatopsis taiwanensis]GLY70549.1 V-type ATP synthase alpha chain [Amycolatopsis taiwanensis]
MSQGHVTRVNGPLVEVAGVGAVAMNDLVAVGTGRMPAEVMSVRDGVVSLQAYDYTGGLAPGAPAVASGAPLAVRLGPGLLGGVHDGLLRPLTTAPVFLAAGAYPPPEARTWRFEPKVRAGDEVRPGEVIGLVPGVGAVEHRVLVPPTLRGTVREVASGAVPADGTVATVAGTRVGLFTDWPVRRARPCRARRDEVRPLVTGQRVLDLLYPIARGSTATVPGGFGTGKTMLLQQLAKWCDADVIIYTGCGERGNEMAEVVGELFALTDPRTGGRLAERTVIIANTSNMPMMAREASVYTAATVAEYYRDMGYDAVVIADSTSRWAEALREFASRRGALPAEEGYPADLASSLAAFYERAGPVETLGGASGSVTIVGAVSPPGGDMTEPVTANTERFVRCRWTLDRDLAYARQYPAVSWSGSFSRDAAAIGDYRTRSGDPRWQVHRARVQELLADADRLSALAELVGATALSGPERVTLLAGRLLREGLLRQSALSTVDASSTPGKTGALADAILAVVDRCAELVADGVSANTIEEFDFAALVRLHDEAGPDDEDKIAGCRDAILARLDEVAR